MTIGLFHMKPPEATRHGPVTHQFQLFTADEARKNYSTKAFCEAMVEINQAIVDASRKASVVSVTVSQEVALPIKRALQEHGGFDVIIDHESDHSDLTIRW